MFFRSISEKQDARYGVGIILKYLTNGLDHEKKRVGIDFLQHKGFSYALLGAQECGTPSGLWRINLEA